MKTALLVIATGVKYEKYVKPLLYSAKKFFVEHDAILWNDCGHILFGDANNISKEPLGYPGETLHRYHTFLTYTNLLRRYDQLFYCDVDMLFVAPVGEEIFSDGITATEHPGYTGLSGDPERNPLSTAYLPNPRTYFCGGFIGGATEAFLRMAETIKMNVDIDKENGVMARWHDESHSNRYLYDNPPAKILTPSYCYPDVKNDYYHKIWERAGRPIYEPKLLALTKGAR
jgi:histo-blood group ABO system transferase